MQPLRQYVLMWVGFACILFAGASLIHVGYSTGVKKVNNTMLLNAIEHRNEHPYEVNVEGTTYNLDKKTLIEIPVDCAMLLVWRDGETIIITGAQGTQTHEQNPNIGTPTHSSAGGVRPAEWTPEVP